MLLPLCCSYFCTCTCFRQKFLACWLANVVIGVRLTVADDETVDVDVADTPSIAWLLGSPYAPLNNIWYLCASVCVWVDVYELRPCVMPTATGRQPGNSQLHQQQQHKLQLQVTRHHFLNLAHFLIKRNKYERRLYKGNVYTRPSASTTCAVAHVNHFFCRDM